MRNERREIAADCAVWQRFEQNVDRRVAIGVLRKLERIASYWRFSATVSLMPARRSSSAHENSEIACFLPINFSMIKCAQLTVVAQETRVFVGIFYVMPFQIVFVRAYNFANSAFDFEFARMDFLCVGSYFSARYVCRILGTFPSRLCQYENDACVWTMNCC